VEVRSSTTIDFGAIRPVSTSRRGRPWAAFWSFPVAKSSWLPPASAMRGEERLCVISRAYGSSRTLFGLNRLPRSSTSALNPAADPPRTQASSGTNPGPHTR
jgi:hypothetical protein